MVSIVLTGAMPPPFLSQGHPSPLLDLLSTGIISSHSFKYYNLSTPNLKIKTDSINPHLPETYLVLTPWCNTPSIIIFISNYIDRFVQLKEPQTVQEEFELLKEMGDLSVKEFHIIQLAEKQTAALGYILGPLVF